MYLQVGDESHEYNPYSINFFSNTPEVAEVDYSNVDFFSLLMTGSADSYEPFLTSPPEDKTYELSSNDRQM